MNLLDGIAAAWRTPGLLIAVLMELRKQKRYLQEHVQPALDVAFRHTDGSIDEKDIRKIIKYYGLAAPGIVGEAFCALQGRPMAKDERLTATCQGGMTGLFDDFFDKHSTPEARLIELVNEPAKVTAAASNEELFLYFYRTALQQVPDPAEMKACMAEVYAAQVASKAQEDPAVSNASLEKIMYQKGGCSTVFYRTAFNDRVSVPEKNMLMQLGSLIQLSNDIFDLYKDMQQGIHTLVTRTTNITELKKYYTDEIARFAQMVWALGYGRLRTLRFLDRFSITVFSRCYVCLEQFARLQQQTSNVFTPGNYSRQELVCDMDTANNKWKSVQYHWKYAGRRKVKSKQ